MQMYFVTGTYLFIGFTTAQFSKSWNLWNWNLCSVSYTIYCQVMVSWNQDGVRTSRSLEEDLILKLQAGKVLFKLHEKNLKQKFCLNNLAFACVVISQFFFFFNFGGCFHSMKSYAEGFKGFFFLHVCSVGNGRSNMAEESLLYLHCGSESHNQSGSILGTRTVLHWGLWRWRWSTRTCSSSSG